MTGMPAEDSATDLPETRTLPGEQDRPRAAPGADVPQRLGRYVVLGKLGQGGFADVFLARDEELDRQVALKLPRADGSGSPAEFQSFVEEARTSARFQHPRIVQVYDAGSHAGTPFIVLEYIRGRSLAHLLKHESVSPATAAQILLEIAEALAYAHDRGFVHRDIKPQNILLDVDDHPHVADFGLAVRQWDHAEAGERVAGTKAYMAPEQVRGETHRMDARTDIWAMGVVLYQMLTGSLPFTGATRREIFQQILNSDPVPPRQRRGSIPAELERICLRCLCRQMSDRYRRATDLAADLIEWLESAAVESGSARRRPGMFAPPDVPVVPRGLRSFEREDGDFFLKLIPGPRDREGLPAAIRFWKNRVEQRDPEETFALGVLYGPSGCGKSSLLKAGLLPRLNSDVIALYVEATARDTEARLLNAIRKSCGQSVSAGGLDDGLRELRVSPELRNGKKVLLILDQFEQWLDAWRSEPAAELVRALRQCDGGNVQAILLVRDDFWLPVSRFTRDLEVGIVEGSNGMLVDSFDLQHARRVLRELGVGYGRLPASGTAQSTEQSAFLDQAVEALAEGNRIYPVRLTVFVEMVKDREWTPSLLAELGGAEGVGVAFLEASAGSRASPARKIHAAAIRRILASLLPPAGQIKDRVRTRRELLEASQYQDRLHDFESIIRMLDVDLRLITSTQCSHDDSPEAPDDQDAFPEAVYQLTHDFLIPSIREWLARQARGSRTGRAQLLLQEQAEIWNSRPSPRYLPSLIEWIGIWRRTSRRQWTEPQRRMMRAAGRRILRGSLIIISAVAAAAACAAYIFVQLNVRWGSSEAQRLVSKLQDVEIADVPHVATEMLPYRRWAEPALHREFDEPNAPAGRRVRAALALLPNDSEPVPWLVRQLANEQTPPQDWLVIRHALLPHREVADQLLRSELAAAEISPRLRFRIACALAGFDDRAEVWDAIGGEIAASLLREPAADASAWIAALRPAGEHLRRPLAAALSEAKSLEAARIGAMALFEFADGQVHDLIEILAAADATRYRAVAEVLKRNPALSLPAVKNSLARLSEFDSKQVEDDLQARQMANLILASWELGDPRPLRERSVARLDPRLRTYLIHGMTPERMSLDLILPLIIESPPEPALLNVALMAATFHVDEPMSAAVREKLLVRLREIYRHAADPEAHSVSGLLLRRLRDDRLADMDRELAQRGPDAAPRWWVTKSGLTMIAVDPAIVDGSVDPQGAGRRFAISSTETPLKLYKEFNPAHVQGVLRVTSDNVPATALLAVELAGYCNWLSERDGIAADEWCYPPAAEMTVADCHPLARAMDKTGYRLPSAAEWELACGCGKTAARFYGDDPELLRDYGWELANSERVLHPVAELRPNPLGIFDVYGNAEELCISGFEAWLTPGTPTYVGKGGSSLAKSGAIMTHSSSSLDYRQRSDFVGFRIVRSLPIGGE